MSTAYPLPVAVILLAGLTTACGQNAATVNDSDAATVNGSADSQVESQVLQDNAAAPNGAGVATSVEVADTPAPAQEKPAVATTTALPLKLGHYVRSDTPCDRASRADMVALVTRTGMNLNCTFKKIEKTGATTYRVTSACSDGGAAWGRTDSIETSTDTYEIPNETSFTVKYEGGSESSARYCARVDSL